VAKKKKPAKLSWPLPRDWNDAWKGSILEYSPPDGFDKEGRRTLVECPEFRLVELWVIGGETIIERSPSVEFAFWKSVFRIIDREDSTTQAERISTAAAIRSLFRFTNSESHGFTDPVYASPHPLTIDAVMQGRGGGAVACRFANTIGRRLIEISGSTDVKIAIDDCTSLFKSALSAFAVSQGLIPDKRSKTGINAPFFIIATAEEIFFRDRRRPAKSEIQSACESRGMKFSGKDQRGKWGDAFTKAGLGELPDSPPT
jgi:hypothetical protein